MIRRPFIYGIDAGDDAMREVLNAIIRRTRCATARATRWDRPWRHAF